MRKNILPILIIFVVLLGLSIAVFLSQQQAILRNNAALPNGTGTIVLNPASSTHYVGNIFPVTLQVNTANTSITSISFRITYPYVNSTPELNIVDQAGNPVNQITPDPSLVSSGNWSFPVKAVTRSGNLVTVDFAAINTNIAGFSSNSPVTFATIYFKVNNPLTSPLTLTFDQTQSRMMTKSNAVDILKTPTNGSFTLLAPTPTPSPTPTHTPTPTPTHTPSPTPTLTPVPTHTPTPTPVVTASPTPTITASPVPTPTITPTPTPIATLNFKVKMQAINNTGPNSVFTVILKSGSSTVSTHNINAVSNSSGVYSGSFSNITPGLYDIYIKETSHLQRKFTSINLVNGTNTLDWTSIPLLVGDFDNNNFINITDIGKILAIYTNLTTQTTSANQMFDINNDGVINVVDIALALSNYTALQVPGD